MDNVVIKIGSIEEDSIGCMNAYKNIEQKYELESKLIKFINDKGEFEPNVKSCFQSEESVTVILDLEDGNENGQGFTLDSHTILPALAFLGIDHIEQTADAISYAPFIIGACCIECLIPSKSMIERIKFHENSV